LSTDFLEEDLAPEAPVSEKTHLLGKWVNSGKLPLDFDTLGASYDNKRSEKGKATVR